MSEETANEEAAAPDEAPPGEATEGDAPAPAAPDPDAVPWRFRLKLAAIAAGPALALQAIAAAAPGAVEAGYTNGVYRPIVWTLNLLTGWLPFSLAELLLIAAIGAIVFLTGRAIVRIKRGERRLTRSLQRGLSAAIAGAAVLYGVFVLSWGLNYRRPPFARSAGYDAALPSAKELEALGHELVAEANRRRADPRIVEDANGVMQLPEGASRAALARAMRGYEALAPEHAMIRSAYGPPKPVLFSTVMSYLNTTGIFIPFTGEANVNVTAPHCRLPFIACHELAHQQGFASEDEASFVAFLVCRAHPDADYAYSGTLMAANSVENALHRSPDRDAVYRVIARRSDAVKRDLRALTRWYETYQTPVGELADKVNDTYLKLQGKTDGVQSYGRMVDLLVAERRTRPR